MLHALPWFWAAFILVRVKSLLLSLNPSGLHKPLLSPLVPWDSPTLSSSPFPAHGHRQVSASGMDGGLADPSLGDF